MSVLTVADVVEALSDIRPQRATQVITEAAVSARKVIPSGMFVCLPNAEIEVDRAIEEAIERGMALALVQRDLPVSFPSINVSEKARLILIDDLDLPLCLQVENTLSALHQLARYWRHKRADAKAIGITGSIGKTTSKDLITDVLGRRFRTLKNSGDLESIIDVPLSLLGLSGGHQRVVLEIDIPGAEIILSDVVSPQIGVVTHLEANEVNQTLPDELDQKIAAFVRSLPDDGIAILNYDDLRVRNIARETLATPFFYGLTPEADLWADEVEGLGLGGIQFRLHFGHETILLRVPMIGRHSVHTALRAAAVGIVENLSWQEIVEGLRFGNIQLRLVVEKASNGALLLDDTYNTSTNSMLAALNLLNEMEGRKVAVLGRISGLGHHELRDQQMIGIRTAQVVDFLITVGEAARLIASAARSAKLSPSKVKEVSSIDEVIKLLVEELKPDDVVLIKGPRELDMDRIVTNLEAVL